MPIKVLSPEVVAQIAAGEVVERPASVVKELIENSLDASATQITVEALGGGVRFIRVADNGAGIPSSEAELAFQRYATSKLSILADLDEIATLGFRGEALPSIATVAEVTIVTRAQGDLGGTYLSLQNGAVVRKGQRSSPPGTTITVHNLFRNVPARLKFLKSQSTENSHIGNVVSQYSLAFPEVRFTLHLEGRPVLRTAGDGDTKQVIVQIYGLETVKVMLEVRTLAEEPNEALPKVWGYVSAPSVTRSSRRNISFFVNRRWVQSSLLSAAVEEAYRGFLMTGRHPIAVINLALPPQDMDVNIHPTKREVRFVREGEVFSALQRTVRKALVEGVPVTTLKSLPGTPIDTISQGQMPTVASLYGEIESSAITLPSPKPAMQTAVPPLRLLGQLGNTYIVAEGPDGVYLIDQHAAHERVLFERLKAARLQQAVEVQGLLQPAIIQLSPHQEAIWHSCEQTLSEYGFALEPFGERTYLVRAVPALVKGKPPAEAIEELLETVSERDALGELQEKIAISLACQGAVKAGQTLSQEEMRQLVRDLESTNLPRTCPHGRPTMIHVSSAQLAKEFGRA